MESLNVVIMAAGKGTRMGGDAPKVLSRTRFGSLLKLVLTQAAACLPSQITVVTGYGRELVEQEAREAAESLGFSADKLLFAVQEKQLGTGDAIKSALSTISSFKGSVLILSGDMPLIADQTLRKFCSLHETSKATLSILSGNLLNPGSYGRVIRDKTTGEVLRIQEARDCNAVELLCQEVNAGVYLVDSAFLTPAIENLKNDNAQKEYYLTDIVGKAIEEGQRVCSMPVQNIEEMIGVNTVAELMQVERILQRKLIEELSGNGVCFADPTSVTIHPESKIGRGVTIGPNTFILEGCTIGDGVTIEGSCYIRELTVGKNSVLRFGLRGEESSIGEQCTVGPFAHIRPDTTLEDGVKIGNFVETKSAHLKKGAKASHLSYLGDCEVGAESNIGAGTIFCNYDGKKKSRTTIGEGVFIGSNSALVAPLKVADRAFVGAGSVITKDVSSESLALTRAEQKEIKGWAKRKRS